MLDSAAFAKYEPDVDGALNPGRRTWRRFVPMPILACLIEGRNPSEAEIDAVASHIWCCMGPGRTAAAWAAIAGGSAIRLGMFYAARAALGMGSPRDTRQDRMLDRFISYYDI